MKGKQRAFFWSGIVVVLTFLTLIIIQIAKPNNEGSTILTDQEWIKGNESASVSLIEYSDFQCPACGVYYSHVKSLAEEFGDRIKIIYRHYPLEQIHPYANLSAQAAEAAGQQGQFWQMHDLLFENQSTWSNSQQPEQIFVDYANQLGLDIEKFKNDMDSREIKNAIRDDEISGNQALVEGTPTFFLNGQKIANPLSYDKFRQIINNELEKQQ
ncbi:DsbA family protein [Patescibacteria group bacterium]|nr:DsbA family protein [Patescibacteria group bacterium]